MASRKTTSGTLGDRIRQLRCGKGWSQPELAQRIGTSPTQISKYERGTYIPKPHLLGRLAETLGTTTDFLITGHGPQAHPDPELRALLPVLETLPKELRSLLAGFLEALVRTHQVSRNVPKRQPRT